MDYKIYPNLPKKRDWKIGCIGAGFIMSDCHVPNYVKAGFNPFAVSSENDDTALKLAEKFNIPHHYTSYLKLLENSEIEVLDIAVPPQHQLAVIRAACNKKNIKGILAQKPLGVNFAEAQEIVTLCEKAGIQLVVNQNMRYDHSMRALKTLLVENKLGQPVFGSVDMRAIPHWAPWQQPLGWLTLRIMSIHHLDIARFLFGDPEKVYCSYTKDPRTKFQHEDGICLTILEYASGFRFSITDDVWAGPAKEGSAEDCFVRWRVEGTLGLAKGEIGWPKWPQQVPSTLTWSNVDAKEWHNPQWQESWFPHAFLGPMAELLSSLEGVPAQMPGKENLRTMLLVEACYLSGKTGQVINFSNLCKENNL